MVIRCATQQFYRTIEYKKKNLVILTILSYSTSDRLPGVARYTQGTRLQHRLLCTLHNIPIPFFSWLYYFFKRIDVVLFRTEVLDRKKKSRRLHCCRIIPFECKKLMPFQTSQCWRTFYVYIIYFIQLLQRGRNERKNSNTISEKKNVSFTCLHYYYYIIVAAIWISCDARTRIYL